MSGLFFSYKTQNGTVAFGRRCRLFLFLSFAAAFAVCYCFCGLLLLLSFAIAFVVCGCFSWGVFACLRLFFGF